MWKSDCCRFGLAAVSGGQWSQAACQLGFLGFCPSSPDLTCARGRPLSRREDRRKHIFFLAAEQHWSETPTRSPANAHSRCFRAKGRKFKCEIAEIIFFFPGFPLCSVWK